MAAGNEQWGCMPPACGYVTRNINNGGLVG